MTEQRRGTYKYFVDRGDGMEAVNTRTEWVDKVQGLPMLLRIDSELFGSPDLGTSSEKG